MLTFSEEDLDECSVYIPVEVKNLLSFIYSLTFDFKSSMHTNVASFFFHHLSCTGSTNLLWQLADSNVHSSALCSMLSFSSSQIHKK